MASSEEFKAQLKAGKIVDALATALSQAVELEITTWVASSSDPDVEASSSAANFGKPGYRLRTRINLIEGKIDNEIGNQFIGNGPYRELQQFHQEQVTDSPNIIQNNLNSLQKLFGILVKLRQPSPDVPAIEPSESSGDIGSVLPPADRVVERTIELSESTASSSIPSPPATTHDSLPSADIGGVASIPLVETPPFPAAPVTNLAPSGLGMDEDWEDLIIEDEHSPTAPATHLDSSSGFDNNWVDLGDEQPTPVPTQPSSEWETDESWEEIEEQPTPAPIQPSSEWETDEDWGDLEEAPLEPSSGTTSPSLEFSNLTDDNSSAKTSEFLEFSNLENDEWEEPIQPDAASSSSLDLKTDEEWPTAEPIVPIPTANGYSWDMGIEEHWQKFEVEELELHATTSEEISLEPTSAVAELEGLDDPLDDLISLESQLNQSSEYDLLLEDFDEEPFAQTNPSRIAEIDANAAYDDSLTDLFGESVPGETLHKPSTESLPTRADAMLETQTPAAESYSMEDTLFSDTPFDETIPSGDEIDLLAAFDDEDLTTARDSRLPAPPPLPQNQSKNQSNEKQGG